MAKKKQKIEFPDEIYVVRIPGVFSEDNFAVVTDRAELSNEKDGTLVSVYTRTEGPLKLAVSVSFVEA